MKTITGLLIFLFVGFSCFAQLKTDSLLDLLHRSQSDENKITLLNQLAWELNYADPDQAAAYAKQAIDLSLKTGNIRGLAIAYRYLTVVHQNISMYDLASAYADSAANYYTLLNDSLGLAGIYNSRGTINYYRSNFAEALMYYEKSFAIYHKAGQKQFAAILINNIALALSEMSNYKEALEKYFEALHLHEETGNEQGKALTLSNIGIIYFNLGNYDRAIEFYSQSLEIRLRLNDAFGIASTYANIGNALGMKKEYQPAFRYLHDALEIFKEKKDLNNEALVCSLLGQHLAASGKEAEGIKYYGLALEIHKQTGNMQNRGVILYDLALINLKENQLPAAYAQLSEASQIFRETGNVDMLSRSFEGLSKYYETKGQHKKALGYYKDFKQIQDSIFASGSEERIAAAELRYESEKKEAEISRLTGDAALQKLQVQKHRQGRNIFLFLTLLVLLLAMLLFVRYRLKNKLAHLLKQKNDELTGKEALISRQKDKIERQYQKLSELDEAKTRFFANISHEFRTPLTLVQGPIDDVLGSDDEKLSENASQKLRLARRNLGQLKTLTEQLLDLSKLKAGKLKLRAQRQDLVPYLNRTINSFQSAIPGNKRIEFVFSSNVEALQIFFDTEKLDRIINNLVSNAIKAIESSGNIHVKLIAPAREKEEENSFVKIEIADNGCGISEKDLSLIFNRFYRADNSGLGSNTGTGIGLELTRELVELHGGSIEAESELGKGSKFTLQLPSGSDHLEASEMIEVANVEFAENKTQELTESVQSETFPVSHEFSVLVVEDHPDMLNYIAENLNRHFTVITAANGIEALEKIGRQVPDMIVSDLMMPGMDGMALLRHIRDHKNISHIPFILLTARADDEGRLAGYQMKADAYITKPFNTGELLIRIRNLLETRQDIKQKYAKKVLSVAFDREGLTSADKQFLDKMKQVVIRNLSDHHFGMSELASAAFLGERQLRRKLTELTGLPPVEFIRQIRLQQAKVLLEENVYSTVSEVSAAVGFNNPAYFSRLFSKLFGQTPQELIKSVLQ